MRLKLVTLNLWHGEKLDAICSFLIAEKPDVIFMQEVFDGQDPHLARQYRTLSELKKRLDLPFCAYEAAHINILPDDAGKAPEGNAIFSRFPILDQEAIFFNDPFRDDYVDDNLDATHEPRTLLHATLKTPAGEVHAYNLHGSWDLDGDNFGELRRQMSEAVVSATKDKQNVILGGDTNAKPTNQALRNVEQHLTSVFGTELTTTFNMRHKTNPGYGTAAVDMVFVSPNLKVISKSCPDVDVSDHFPLIVTFEIPETAKVEG